MQTHDHAIEFLGTRGIAATRRKWALGDTLVVPIVPGTEQDGITVHDTVVWLVPHDGGWDVVQVVFLHERRIHLGSLPDACEKALTLRNLHDLHEECSACGASRQWAFGERVMADAVRWWESHRCAGCGYCTEADGGDSLPEELRTIELARSGTWYVRLSAVHSVHGWKAVRETLSLGLPAVAALRRELPCDVFTGTCAEALFVLGRLRTASVVAELGCKDT